MCVQCSTELRRFQTLNRGSDLVLHVHAYQQPIRAKTTSKSHKPLLASTGIVSCMTAWHVLRYISAVKRGIVVSFFAC